jgi:hypothetical protein
MDAFADADANEMFNNGGDDFGTGVPWRISAYRY